MKTLRGAWALCCLCSLGVSASANAAQHLVTIEGMRFTPQVVQARPGDTITWQNRDLVAHNVTGKAIQLRSNDLAPGQSWRYTVQGASFDYVCTLHPMMTGRVEVEARAGAQVGAAASRAGARPRDPAAKMK